MPLCDGHHILRRTSLGCRRLSFALARLHEDMRVFSGHINDGTLALSLDDWILAVHSNGTQVDLRAPDRDRIVAIAQNVYGIPGSAIVASSGRKTIQNV